MIIVDAYVIDHVFQPVADWLEAIGLGIFRTSKFLADGAAFCLAMDTAWGFYQKLPIAGNEIPGVAFALMLAMISYVLLPFLHRFILSMGERTRAGMFNPCRVTFLMTRLISASLTANATVTLWFAPNVDHALMVAAWGLWMLATYIGSCSRRPPHYQFSRAATQAV